MKQATQVLIAKELRKALRRRTNLQGEIEATQQILTKLDTEAQHLDSTIKEYRRDLDPSQFDVETGKVLIAE